MVVIPAEAGGSVQAAVREEWTPLCQGRLCAPLVVAVHVLIVGIGLNRFVSGGVDRLDRRWDTGARPGLWRGQTTGDLHDLAVLKDWVLELGDPHRFLGIEGEPISDVGTVVGARHGLCHDLGHRGATVGRRPHHDLFVVAILLLSGGSLGLPIERNPGVLFTNRLFLLLGSLLVLFGLFLSGDAIGFSLLGRLLRFDFALLVALAPGDQCFSEQIRVVEVFTGWPWVRLRLFARSGSLQFGDFRCERFPLGRNRLFLPGDTCRLGLGRLHFVTELADDIGVGSFPGLVPLLVADLGLGRITDSLHTLGRLLADVGDLLLEGERRVLIDLDAVVLVRLALVGFRLRIDRLLFAVLGQFGCSRIAFARRGCECCLFRRYLFRDAGSLVALII